MRIIAADETRTCYWCHTTKKLLNTKPAGPHNTFVLRAADFWQWQSVLELDSPAQRIKQSLVLCLSSIDGSDELVAQFIERPVVTDLVNELHAAAVELSTGN